MKVVCQSYSACVLLNNTNVVCWGINTYGNLGAGTGNPSVGLHFSYEMGDNLTAIDVGTGKHAVDIFPGIYNLLILRNDSTLVSVGRGSEGINGNDLSTNIGTSAGQLGNALIPIDIGGSVGTNFSLVDEILGLDFYTACVIYDSRSKLRCWGDVDVMGVGASTLGGYAFIGASAGSMAEITDVLLPSTLSNLKGPRLNMPVGGENKCVSGYSSLSSARVIYCFGNNHECMFAAFPLGDGDNQGNTGGTSGDNMVVSYNTEDVALFHPATNHMIFLKSTSPFPYVTGINRFGTLGIGSSNEGLLVGCLSGEPYIPTNPFGYSNLYAISSRRQISTDATCFQRLVPPRINYYSEDTVDTIVRVNEFESAFNITCDRNDPCQFTPVPSEDSGSIDSFAYGTLPTGFTYDAITGEISGPTADVFEPHCLNASATNAFGSFIYTICIEVMGYPTTGTTGTTGTCFFCLGFILRARI